MITQFQYQQVCDELADTRSMVKVLQEEVGELDKEIVELEKENWEYREYQGAWVERLIAEGKKVEELEKEIGIARGIIDKQNEVLLNMRHIL